MSYILDALRKADAQRVRDSARGIHAQPVPSAAHTPERAGVRPWMWAVAAVGLVSLAAAAWQLLKPAPAPAPVVVVQAPPPLPAPVVQAPPAPANEVLPAAPPPAPVVALPPPVAPPPQRAPARADAPPLPAAAPAAAAPVQAAPVAPAPASAASAAPLVAGTWPGDVAKPSLSGGVYSDNPAQRMLIVNGQVLGEGAEVAKGLLLEQIRPKAAVFNWRGQRYMLAY